MKTTVGKGVVAVWLLVVLLMVVAVPVRVWYGSGGGVETWRSFSKKKRR